MDIVQYIFKFFYHIRYWLLYGSLVVTGLVIYATRFLPQSYTVNTTIFTGIVSGTTLSDGSQPIPVNNAFDNIINLVKARSTLENVSIKLLALNLMYGDPETNNTYITANNYKKLLTIVPEEVLKLVDKKSLDKTIENLSAYKDESPDNFIFELLNRQHPHYSFRALSGAKIKRLGSSDIIEIEYQGDDPGITHRTVQLLSEELFKKYEEIRYKSTNDVIKYFEEQLKILAAKLHGMEDSLTRYNIQNKIINYDEQTKAIAGLNNEYQLQLEQMLLDYNSSTALLQALDKQMEGRMKLLRSNTDFLKALDDLSTINGKVTEIESLNTGVTPENNQLLARYKKLMGETEDRIQKISQDMMQLRISKEGIAANDVVSQWLTQLIKNVKSKAELEVMKKRRERLDEQYNIFSPVGTNLKRRERELSLTENSYLQFQRALNDARLRQKNIEMSTSALNVVTPPSYPLMSNPGKRFMLVLAAFFGSLLFITGFFLIIELLDRTLRDAVRARRLTKLPVLSVFPGKGQLRYRGYNKACNRIAAAYGCNQLSAYLEHGKTSIINLVSFEKEEGKTFIATYLKEYWEEIGFNVRIVSYQTDYDPHTKVFIQAQSLYDIYQPDPNEPTPDIIIVEHPALKDNHISTKLLEEAQINLLVVDACRVWKSSDTKLLANFLKQIKDKPLYLLLNKTDREYVEDFTGQLPPYSSYKNLTFRLSQFGITAEKV